MVLQDRAVSETRHGDLSWLMMNPPAPDLAAADASKSQVSSEESSKSEEENNRIDLQQQQQQQQQHQQQLNLLALLPNQQQQQQQQQYLPGALGMVPPLGHPAIPHNLIPLHLQGDAIAASLNGTPGHQPALIPGIPVSILAAQQQQLAAAAAAQQLVAAAAASQAIPFCVQDRPHIPPVYNGVNPNYPGLRLLHANPPVFAVDNFLNPFECQFLVHSANDCFGPAPVVGKGAGEISPSRTSSTCYLAREDLPDYLRKVSLLTGKPVEHCELPQVGRYYPSQQYLQHFDAFDLSNDDGRRFASNGGQRTVTVLVYLNDVPQGGQTSFPALNNLKVQPMQGMAVVFFPATVDGLLDKMALHAALPAIDTKYISQVWIRQADYQGQPSKRLPQTLGVPFGAAPAAAAGF